MFFSNLTQIRNLFESLPSEERKTVVLLDISVTPLIYTPFGGLQSRGAGLARLAGRLISTFSGSPDNTSAVRVF